MKKNLRRGSFAWRNNIKDAEVEFKWDSNGKHLFVWRPSLLQRLLIWLRVIIDPRVNGSKVNYNLIDEVGHWPTKWYNKEEADTYMAKNRYIAGIDPYDKNDKQSKGSL